MWSIKYFLLIFQVDKSCSQEPKQFLFTLVSPSVALSSLTWVSASSLTWVSASSLNLGLCIILDTHDSSIIDGSEDGILDQCLMTKELITYKSYKQWHQGWIPIRGGGANIYGKCTCTVIKRGQLTYVATWGTTHLYIGRSRR